jgi:hypothetical protein
MAATWEILCQQKLHDNHMIRTFGHVRQMDNQHLGRMIAIFYFGHNHFPVRIAVIALCKLRQPTAILRLKNFDESSAQLRACGKRKLSKNQSICG